MPTNGSLSGFYHPLFITIVFIVLSTFVGAFIKGRKKDKCLKAFRDCIITLEDVSGK